MLICLKSLQVFDKLQAWLWTKEKQTYPQQKKDTSNRCNNFLMSSKRPSDVDAHLHCLNIDWNFVGEAPRWYFQSPLGEK